MNTRICKTFYEYSLSDVVQVYHTLTLQQVWDVFYYFQNHPLFKWYETHNDCEDRANAIGILLDEWQIPNYKGWVFSGCFLKNINGALNNMWNYHVAVILPVYENNLLEFYTIDPTTLSEPRLLIDWADNVTAEAESYYLIKNGIYYIFNSDIILQNNWHSRDDENYTWTIEGLAGINGADPNSELIKYNNQLLITETNNAFNQLRFGGSPFTYWT
jgi:hypothetical protein